MPTKKKAEKKPELFKKKSKKRGKK